MTIMLAHDSAADGEAKAMGGLLCSKKRFKDLGHITGLNTIAVIGYSYLNLLVNLKAADGYPTGAGMALGGVFNNVADGEAHQGGIAGAIRYA